MRKATGLHQTLHVAVAHKVKGDESPDTAGRRRLPQHPEQAVAQSHPTPLRVDDNGNLCDIFIWSAFITGDPNSTPGRVERNESEPSVIVDFGKMP